MRDNNYKKRENFVSKTYYCKSYPDQQKNNGLYFPMISILNSKGGHQDPKSVLEIQVSLPKLMYGTNFFEVDKPDINIIYQKFLSILNQLGIETSVDQLKLAIVKRADFSKMIITTPLCGGCMVRLLSGVSEVMQNYPFGDGYVLGRER